MLPDMGKLPLKRFLDVGYFSFSHFVHWWSQWDSKHPEFVSESLQLINCNPHSDEFTSKTRALNSVLSLGIPYDRCHVDQYDHTSV